tara:strand:+ start:1062 stop:1424 length:363 start_codon:yes stop_codon:yes gene_type:complete
MAFYMKPGRGPMMKTGNGIPQTFQSPDALDVSDVSDEQVEAPSALLQTDPIDKDLERYKKQFPNSTVTVKGDNKKQPSWAEKKAKKFSIMDKNGNSISATSGGKVQDNSMSVKDIINKTN